MKMPSIPADPFALDGGINAGLGVAVGPGAGVRLAYGVAFGTLVCTFIGE